jgi:peptidoglycan hydrolase-like protein with peptidoglycan-binding domain
MLAPEENLSVLRVQEALRAVGFPPGALDGIFGDSTGTAVSAFKDSRGLQPSDPVVGQGTSGQLDSELFVDPPNLDPAFGEVAGFVAGHVLEPFVGFELAPLINAPLNSQRHDTGAFFLSVLNSGQLLAFIAGSRAADVAQDPRIPPDITQLLAAGLGPASGITFHFIGTDGQPHTAIIVDDITIRGLRFLTHRPTGRKAKITLRSTVCHELSHVRNDGLGLDNTPDFITEVFLDPNLAASRTQATGVPSAAVFAQFAHEMMARHVDWIIERENAGDPFAAQFLQPAALAEGAHFYFAESDPSFYFHDNGYLQGVPGVPGILNQGHTATYHQIALWLRQVAGMNFSGNPQAQQTSAQLFRDAADAADHTALNPDEPRPQGSGLFPLSNDFQ